MFFVCFFSSIKHCVVFLWTLAPFSLILNLVLFRGMSFFLGQLTHCLPMLQ